MPRLKPAPGYMTAKEVKDELNVSYAMLSQYVSKGWLNRYGPENRKHKFYRRSEVFAFKEARNAFPQLEETKNKRIACKLLPATINDLHAIAEMDEKLFNVSKYKDKYTSKEDYLAWITRVYYNFYRILPEAFFALKDSAKTLVGFAILLPLKDETLDRFIHDEIGMDSFTENDIPKLMPGKPLQLYIIAIGIDQQYDKERKRWFGRELIDGLYQSLENYADRGIEFSRVVARSFTGDGIRLMRKMGFTHHRSPVSHKELFSVIPADSGIGAFMEYTNRLNRWKEQHTEGKELCSTESEK